MRPTASVKLQTEARRVERKVSTRRRREILLGIILANPGKSETELFGLWFRAPEREGLQGLAIAQDIPIMEQRGQICRQRIQGKRAYVWFAIEG